MVKNITKPIICCWYDKIIYLFIILMHLLHIMKLLIFTNIDEQNDRHYWEILVRRKTLTLKKLKSYIERHEKNMGQSRYNSSLLFHREKIGTVALSGKMFGKGLLKIIKLNIILGQVRLSKC